MQRLVLFFVLALATPLIGALEADAGFSPIIVRLNTGLIRGQIGPSGLSRTFLGIPYAEPPTGKYRWKSPRAARPWSGERNATEFGPGCPQRCTLPPHLCPEKMSEDCLSINVYTPVSIPADTLLPVMIFIHGGSFEFGTAGCDLYRGENLTAAGNVVVITFNYRLGALGWLYHGNGSVFQGNYGLEDQWLAMKWVQQNAKAFGGDPRRVTLWGQSAGAISVGVHMAAPASTPFFNRAIMESNPLTLPDKTPARGTAEAQLLFKSLGCDPANHSCIFDAPVDRILDAQTVVDTTFDYHHPLQVLLPWSPLTQAKGPITFQTLDAFKNKAARSMPLLLGATSEDALMFVYLGDSSPINAIEYVGVVSFFFTTGAPWVLKIYPPDALRDLRPQLSTLLTDYVMVCSSRHIADLARSFFNSSDPVYYFQFNHALSFDGWGPNYTFCRGKVCHGAELPFVFYPPIENYTSGLKFTPEERELSLSMMKAWTNFAHTGDPNKGHSIGVEWPAWDSKRNAAMFGIPNASFGPANATQCDFWDSMGYQYDWDTANAALLHGKYNVIMEQRSPWPRSRA